TYKRGEAVASPRSFAVWHCRAMLVEIPQIHGYIAVDVDGFATLELGTGANRRTRRCIFVLA
ncbi:MAG: hypothetical protein J4O02_02480, partial [Chloroflexi bacterium]|nr:hypothetical protein [Chloroflexota bacterium]